MEDHVCKQVSGLIAYHNRKRQRLMMKLEYSNTYSPSFDGTSVLVPREIQIPKHETDHALISANQT